jgi:pimeloyl-ACP methyl ester carboxylesterase
MAYIPLERRTCTITTQDGVLILAFSQTDFVPDLKKITVAALVMHGDDDQIVPYAEADTINADLLAFIKS